MHFAIRAAAFCNNRRLTQFKTTERYYKMRLITKCRKKRNCTVLCNYY